MRKIMAEFIAELNALPRPPVDRVKVVSVRNGLPAGTVYVGRPMPKAYKGSVFANPFKVGSTIPVIGKLERGQAVELYVSWLAGVAAFPELRESRQAIIEEFPLLRARINAGMKLGCWCAPEACHADALVAMAQAMDGEPDDALPDFRKVVKS